MWRGPAPPKGIGREVFWIEALLDRNLGQGVNHVFVDHVEDALGHLVLSQRHGGRQFLQRKGDASPIGTNLAFTAQSPSVVQATQE